MQFNNAFDELIDSEGSYSDDPQDPGNWTSGVCGKGECKGTKYGIAANSYGSLDIKRLTLDDAKAIYKRDYWDVWQFNGLTSPLPDSLQYELFDAAVNTGLGNASRFLQRALKVADDGAIGNVTIKALDDALTNFGIARVEQWFLAEKLDHYTNLSTWGRFGRGWTKRVVKSLKNI
jgi:lysozyme family protein